MLSGCLNSNEYVFINVITITRVHVLAFQLFKDISLLISFCVNMSIEPMVPAFFSGNFFSCVHKNNSRNTKCVTVDFVATMLFHALLFRVSYNVLLSEFDYNKSIPCVFQYHIVIFCDDLSALIISLNQIAPFIIGIICDECNIWFRNVQSLCEVFLGSPR